MQKRLVISILIFVFGPFVNGFAETTAPSQEVATYDQLLHAIRQTRAASQARIEEAVEQERVREAWETGKLIDEHILFHKERAEYGKQVLKRLAKDLDTSQTEVSFMLQFARAYPIHWPANKLSWSHYQALLALNDPKERDEVMKEAIEKGWGRDRLREEIRRRGLSRSPEEIAAGSARLVAQRGMLDAYRIVKLEGRLQISLGFSNYLDLSKKDAQRFNEGDIVRVLGGKLELEKAATESLVPFQIFSYRATVLEVTDGDTLWALVHLGFGITTKQHLRLRAIDAPEIEGRDGKEAKDYLERVLKEKKGPVLIKAPKSDKYDRYLADIWVGETYINQELIDKGLAVRVSE